jgi:hypothetical protein
MEMGVAGKAVHVHYVHYGPQRVWYMYTMFFVLTIVGVVFAASEVGGLRRRAPGHEPLGLWSL